jgi:predicted ester cyclase
MSVDTANFFSRFGEAWVTGKVETVDDLMPADVLYHLPPFPDMDRDALKGFMTAFHQAFPDFTLSVDEQAVDRDTSAHRWNCRATYTGESALLPVPPTGMATEATGSHFVHWQDGHPVEIWHHGDWLGWLQRCGVVPALG